MFLKRKGFDAKGGPEKRQTLSVRNEQTRSRSVTCPICARSFHEALINIHIDECLRMGNGATGGSTIPPPDTAQLDLPEGSRPENRTSISQEELHVSNPNFLSNATACLDLRFSGSKQSMEVPTSPPLYEIEEPDPLRLKGLYLIREWLSVDEEEALVKAINEDVRVPWVVSNFSGFCDSKQFGVRTEHKSILNSEPRVRMYDISRREFPIPPYMDSVLAKIADLVSAFDAKQYPDVHKKLRSFRPNECNVNRYTRAEGHFLRPHVDDRILSGVLLVNVSLLGDCRMRYNLEKKTDSAEPIDVFLPRRCLQIMSGPSRYDYTHAIPHECFHGPSRLSITFRHASKKRDEFEPKEAPPAKSITSFFQSQPRQNSSA